MLNFFIFGWFLRLSFLLFGPLLLSLFLFANFSEAFSFVLSLSVIVTVVATVAVPAVKLAAVPLALVATSAEGVPRAGVTSVGLLANTNAPLPVSSDITPANSEEVVAANTLILLVV